MEYRATSLMDKKYETLLQKIEDSILKILFENDIKKYISKIIDYELKKTILEDLIALTNKDPAAKGEINYVFDSYNSFKAVILYRVANRLYSLNGIYKETKTKSRKMSEKAKLLTGVEIHLAAKIGKRFVIDHGIGTVIGETTEIGDDCYILQGVLLGAIGIANNGNRKRHPTIGNNVEIGAFSRVLGDIKIGNNVKISPFSIIKQDITNNTNVVINNQCQTIYNKMNKIKIFGIIPVEVDQLHIYGDNLSGLNVALVDKHHTIIDGVDAVISSQDNQAIKVKIKFNMQFGFEPKDMINISLIRNNNAELIISNSAGITELIERQKSYFKFDGFKF